MPHSSYSARYRQECSIRGCKLGELKSGLQKAIRRNELDLALTCGLELWSLGTAPNGRPQDYKRLRTNILHRLMIIFLEDVGQEQYWAQADSFLTKASKDDWPSQESILNWIAFMCALPKSRACSHARSVAKFCDSSWVKLKYPDIYRFGQSCAQSPNLDQVVAATLKRDHRAVLLAYRLSQQKEQIKTPFGRKPMWAPHYALELATKELNLQKRTLDQTTRTQFEKNVATLGLKWGKLLKTTKEAFLCWMLPLLARIHVNSVQFETLDVQPLPSSKILELNTGPVVLPMYVMDMNVTGKPDPERFALEGSMVTHEDFTRVNREWKDLYVTSKCLGISHNWSGTEFTASPSSSSSSSRSSALKRSRSSSELDMSISSSSSDSSDKIEKKEMGTSTLFPNLYSTFKMESPTYDVLNTQPKTSQKETDTFFFVTRIQLTTSHNRTDVYFGTRKGLKPTDTKLLVIKGPLNRLTDAERACALSTWKRQNMIPTTNVHVEWLYPDRWPQGVPLGIRNSADRTKLQPFLISDSLYLNLRQVPIASSITSFDVPVRLHSSKKWPPTQIVDLDILGSFSPVKMKSVLSKREKMDYVVALLYRFVFGLGDLADRNFVRVQGRIFSIDEDGAPRVIRLGFELRRNKAALVAHWCTQYWDDVYQEISKWKLCGPYHERWMQVLSKKERMFEIE